MNIKIRKLFFISSFVILGVVMGIIIVTNFDFLSFKSTAVQNSPIVKDTKRDSSIVSSEILQLEDSFVNVSDQVGKAVVSISTEVTEKVISRRFNLSPFGNDDFFGHDKFFDQFFKDFFGEIPEREFKRRGLGSGVIIDSKGYILTNQHVVDNADKITVALPDGREFKGEVKGEDLRSDLAVIKIDADNLLAVKLGNSDDVKIGQWVIAIGNPFGFVVHNPEPTVTAGIISALGRSLPRTSVRDTIYTGLIQTDAAINPGNSGGPLVNLKGEVIGINVAIFTTSGGYQGIGFAIPINKAKRILSSLKEGKEILYGWLGVYIQDIDKELSDYFKLSDQNGILVAKVIKDSPADKAGLKDGDIIVKFNGEFIKNQQQLIEEVSATQVGRVVPVDIIRNSKNIEVKVKIGKRPSEVQEAAAKDAGSNVAKWRGMQVEELTSEISSKYRLDVEEGLLIVDVERGSLAEDAGLSEGDVIISINRQIVNSIDDFRNMISEINNSNALIQTDKGYLIIKGEEK